MDILLKCIARDAVYDLRSYACRSKYTKEIFLSCKYCSWYI